MGVSPSEMAKAISAAGADIIGTNCGNGMERMAPVVSEMLKAAPRGKPIAVHANAGAPVNKGGKTTFPETPEVMAGLVPGVIAAGASIVGGCCGTTPAHIAAIAAVARQTPSRRGGKTR